jgi:hypothetical protein
MDLFILFGSYWQAITKTVLAKYFPSWSLNFRSCQRGSSLTVCARLTVRSSPRQHERKFCRRTCLQSHLQTSPPSPQKSYQKFRNPLCLPQNRLVQGEGGFHEFVWGMESIYFCYFGPLPSFRTIGKLFKNTPLSTQKSHSQGRRGCPWFLLLVGILIFC